MVINLYLNIRDTHLSLKLQIINITLFDAFKREKVEHSAKEEDESDEEPEPYIFV